MTRSDVIDAYFAAMLETVAELERDVERLTRRCVYLEEARSALQSQCDAAIARNVARVVEYGEGPAA